MLRAISVIPIILLFGASMATAKSITVSRTNGGTNGYYSVNENHDSGGLFSEETHTLTCADPGNSSCTWSIPPGSLLVGHAEGEIAGGKLTGTFESDFGNIHASVTWSATDPQNVNIVETQTIIDLD